MNFLDFIFFSIPIHRFPFQKPNIPLLNSFYLSIWILVKLLAKSIDRKIQRIQHTIEFSIYYVFSEEHRLHRSTRDTWETYDAWT